MPFFKIVFFGAMAELLMMKYVLAKKAQMPFSVTFDHVIYKGEE